jgi:hypothetical protein
MYIMCLMREDPLRGQVGGGWALEIETFLGPVKMASSRQASAIWGSKKSRNLVLKQGGSSAVMLFTALFTAPFSAVK